MSYVNVLYECQTQMPDVNVRYEYHGGGRPLEAKSFVFPYLNNNALLLVPSPVGGGGRKRRRRRIEKGGEGRRLRRSSRRSGGGGGRREKRGLKGSYKDLIRTL